ncbi:M48 family metallopeptidase [Arthrobacter sp. GCM10027362]|uniref:M48 family metallopeptidase n=1 Tax=Arthrobacter sp. GCM10027362 TaxID=3273379 RepID=UPI00363AD732
MNTVNAYMRVADIDVDVVYKNIKNLHIGVYPPLGRVRVAAPVRLDDDAVRLAVVQRLPWIRKQRDQLRKSTRQTERKMVTGESHYFWGRRYRLRVINESGHIRIGICGTRMTMHSPAESTVEDRQEALDRWYRAALRGEIPRLIDRWGPVIGREVSKWTIRRMKTKWGSCNRESAHIWFNPELAKKDPKCLEYIVVHEMTHLLERHHNDRFISLMDGFLPDWRARRDELNSAPLRAEEWPER